MQTAVLFHEDCLKHEPDVFPERAARLEAILESLRDEELQQDLLWTTPQPAAFREINRIHRSSYIGNLRELCKAGGGLLAVDTIVGPESYRAALFSAGAALAGVDSVMTGARHAFALCRPPGHHAEAAAGMGFCLFNNAAVAAAHAQAKHGIDRVLIVDVDAHHGNGTEEAFYSSQKVLYMSMHEYPAYPGTGHPLSVGQGDGEGFTVNIPLLSHAADSAYSEALDRLIIPIARQYRPELILASLGFDAHRSDPLCTMQVSTMWFWHLARRLVELSDELCRHRLVAILEGGYDLPATAASARLFTQALVGKEARLQTGPTEAGAEEEGVTEVGTMVDQGPHLRLIEDVIQVQQGYWDL